MQAVSSLIERIDAEFSAAEGRWDQFRAQHLEAYRARRESLKRFERSADTLRELWEPRLEALAKPFGKDMDVRPTAASGRRGVMMEFGSSLARVTLRFEVAPDIDVRKLVVTYDLDILPVLMKFDAHHELELPLDAVDTAQLAKWLDDRIVEFVHSYLALHQNEYYLKGASLLQEVAMGDTAAGRPDEGSAPAESPILDSPPAFAQTDPGSIYLPSSNR